LVDSSPRPIAASHVLHRLLVPRHPPSALDNLTKTRPTPQRVRTQNTTHANNNSTHTTNPTHKRQDHIAEKQDALASTIHISTNNQPQPHPRTHTRQPEQFEHKEVIGPEEPRHATPHGGHAGLFSQIPNRVLTIRPSRTRPGSAPPQGGLYYEAGRCRHELRQCLRQLSPYHHTRMVRVLPRFRGEVLLRKEVIQPHLPVRLPCYDFVPIASPTFDRSLPDGLGHGLRVLPTFVT
jgi:hypothetical protein